MRKHKLFKLAMITIAVVAAAVVFTNTAKAQNIGPFFNIQKQAATIDICYQESTGKLYAVVKERAGTPVDYQVWRSSFHQKGNVIADGVLKANKTVRFRVAPAASPNIRDHVSLLRWDAQFQRWWYMDSEAVYTKDWHKANSPRCPEPKENEEKEEPFSWGSYTSAKPAAADNPNFDLLMANLNVSNSAGQLPCGVFETVYGHVSVNEKDYPACTWPYHVECMSADGAWLTSTVEFHERNPEGDYSPYSAWNTYQNGACGIFND